MPTGPLINAVANLLGCAPYQLPRQDITAPETMTLIHEYLATKRIRTTHLKAGNQELRLHHLSLNGAAKLPAHGNRWGIKVVQHYESRHGIKLRYPTLPCVAVETRKYRYNWYPWEVLSIDDDWDMVNYW